MPGPRDDLIIFDQIAVLLDATGLFSEIALGSTPEEFEIAADRTSAIWIDRTGWTEVPAAAEYITDRTVIYSMILAYRHADITTCWRYLNELESVILNTLNRVSYGGMTMPSFSLVNRGEDLPMKDREQRIRLTGTFRYQFIDDMTDHDVTPPVT